MREAIYKYGSITVTFSLLPDFFNYTTGIYDAEYSCTQNNIANHTLLIIGYGEESGI